MSRQTIPPGEVLPSVTSNLHWGADHILISPVQDAVLTMVNEHATALDNIEANGGGIPIGDSGPSYRQIGDYSPGQTITLYVTGDLQAASLSADSGGISAGSAFETTASENESIEPGSVHVGCLSIDGTLHLERNDVTLSGTQNDVPIPHFGPVIEITGNPIITGFINVTGQGETFILVGACTLKHNTGSSAGNRILLPGGADMVIPANGSATLYYPYLTNAWFVIATSFGATPYVVSAPAALTDSTSGTANDTLEALSSGTVYASDVAAIRNNFADLAAKINAIRTNLINLKLIS